MADSKNDIITNVEATQEDLKEAKKAQFAENPSTRLPRPAQVAEVQQVGVNPQLLQRLKMGQTSAMFSGIVRCIRIVDAGTPNERHCMSMVVNNLTTKESTCTRCVKPRTEGVANPRVINSAMIRLTPQDLQELGLAEDPLYGKGQVPPQPEPAKKPAKSRQNPAKVAESRRAKMPVPNSIKLEISMADLKGHSNVTAVILKKALDAIFELPVKNFREAEEIRVVKERVETLLNQQGEQP